MSEDKQQGNQGEAKTPATQDTGSQGRPGDKQGYDGDGPKLGYDGDGTKLGYDADGTKLGYAVGVEKEK